MNLLERLNAEAARRGLPPPRKGQGRLVITLAHQQAKNVPPPPIEVEPQSFPSDPPKRRAFHRSAASSAETQGLSNDTRAE